MPSNPTYLKATDGKRTVFRKSTRTYRFAGMTETSCKDGSIWVNIEFSNSPKRGLWPCVEITQDEYKTLVAAKKRRTDNNSPQASWVDNAEVAA
jgi:hypothetical protein